MLLSKHCIFWKKQVSNGEAQVYSNEVFENLEPSRIFFGKKISGEILVCLLFFTATKFKTLFVAPRARGRGRAWKQNGFSHSWMGNEIIFLTGTKSFYAYWIKRGTWTDQKWGPLPFPQTDRHTYRRRRSRNILSWSGDLSPPAARSDEQATRDTHIVVPK